MCFDRLDYFSDFHQLNGNVFVEMTRMRGTYDRREVDALAKAPDGVSDGECTEKEEAAEKEYIWNSSGHRVHPAGGTHEVPTVRRAVLLRDTLLAWKIKPLYIKPPCKTIG